VNAGNAAWQNRKVSGVECMVESPGILFVLVLTVPQKEISHFAEMDVVYLVRLCVC
jgi:hypothetical protein